MREQANGLDDFLFLQGNDAAGPSSGRGSGRGSARRSARARGHAAGNGDVRDAAEGRAALYARTAVARSLRGGNQLQKFLWVVKPLLEFGSQRLGGELGGNGIFAGRGIGGDKLDFIDADRGVLVIAQGFLNLFGEVLRFGAAHGKGADQAGKVVEGDLVGKQEGGEPRGGQQLCEAALGLSGFERDAIEKKFVVGNAEQKTSVATFGQRLLEFAPSSLELPLGAFVVRSIKPRVLDQDIEAV